MFLLLTLNMLLSTGLRPVPRESLFIDVHECARLARALGFWREFSTWFTSLTGFYIMALIPNLLLFEGVFLLYLVHWKSHQLLQQMAHYNSEEGLVIYPMSENSAMLKFILQTWENELAICSLILLKVGKEKLWREK